MNCIIDLSMLLRFTGFPLQLYISAKPTPINKPMQYTTTTLFTAVHTRLVPVIMPDAERPDSDLSTTLSYTAYDPRGVELEISASLRRQGRRASRCGRVQCSLGGL
jgi:hypothetical protein